MNDKLEFIIDERGAKTWKLNGKYHREDGPAIEYANGNKAWYINGKYHRVDGPAIEGAKGGNAWFLNGEIYFTKEEWFLKLTPDQQINYLWNMDK